MHIHELRTHNYLKNDGVTVMIDGKTIYDLYFGLEGSREKYKPIPLNKYWLLRFGFHLEDGYYCLDLDHGFTLQEGDKEGYFDVFELNHDTLRVRYIHQLQNLHFALTGKELIRNPQPATK